METYLIVAIVMVLCFLAQIMLSSLHGRLRRYSHQRKKTAPGGQNVFSTDQTSKQEAGLTEATDPDDFMFWDRGGYKKRMTSAHSYFWMYVWAAAFAVGMVKYQCSVFICDDESKKDPENTPLPDILIIVSAVGIVGSVGYIIFEANYSWELSYLKNLLKERPALGYLEFLRKQAPQIKMHVRCFHYELRTRPVTIRDGQGNTTHGSETVTVSVTDHTETEVFYYQRWSDVSVDPRTLCLGSNKVTRVHISNTIRFGDQLTYEAYERHRLDFLQRVSAKGNWENIDLTREDEIEGYQGRITSYWDSGNIAWWMNATVYWVCHVFVILSWPYRWMFNMSSQKIDYQLDKLVFVN